MKRGLDNAQALCDEVDTMVFERIPLDGGAIGIAFGAVGAEGGVRTIRHEEFSYTELTPEAESGNR